MLPFGENKVKLESILEYKDKETRKNLYELDNYRH
jgi:hypothetical protein